MKLRLNLKVTKNLDVGSLKFTEKNPTKELSQAEYEQEKQYVDVALSNGFILKEDGKSVPKEEPKAEAKEEKPPNLVTRMGSKIMETVKVKKDE